MKLGKPIETDRLLIRSFIPEDVLDLQEILGDEETMQYCEPAYHLEKTKTFLQDFCIDRNGAVAAVQKQTGKVIGYILFHGYEPGVYEIGWIFNKEYWRRGYAYEACSALIGHSFEALNIHKVIAETIDGSKSIGLMKKLGMALEEVRKNGARDLDGNWVDLYLFGLLKEDQMASFR